MPFSYWEKAHFTNDIDLLIIGSGIVGLTSALYYKDLFPHHKVVVLERDFLPNGASTKNAGFACLGSPTEILDDLSHRTEEEVLKTLQMRWNGLNRLRSLVGEKEMDYQPCGGFELFRSTEASTVSKVKASLSNLNSIFLEATGQKNAIAFDSSFTSSSFSNCAALRLEGALNPALMIKELLKKTQQAGVQLWNGVTVTSVNESSKMVQTQTDRGAFLSDRVLVCTNGFGNALVADLDLQPARAQVLVAKSEQPHGWKGTFHLNEGYYYFRHIDEHRLLFGGGRQLDFKGETTTEIATTELIQNNLEEILKQEVLGNTSFSVETRWAGIMGVGGAKQPIIKRSSDRIGMALRMGGMGIAIGSEVGHQAARLWS